jgi:hypothetical protein
MIKNLILHLGDTKTGSTALQSVLRSGNFRTPQGQTVFYPGESLNQNRLPNSFSKGTPKGRSNALFASLAADFRKSDADFGILSAELFQSVDPADLKRILTEEMSDFADRTRLISYVRPHAERLVSTFSEQTKFGKVSDDLRSHFQKLRRSGRLKYYPRFTAWQETFGDQFSLRLFQRDHFLNGDVIGDFFAWMLGQEGTVIQAAQLSNASLSVGQIALLRRFQTLMDQEGKVERGGRMSPEVARALVAQFRLTGLGADTPRVTIPDDISQRVTHQFGEDAAQMDAAFFQGTPLSDAIKSIPEKLIGPNQDFDASSYFSDDTLRAFDTMAQMSILLLGENPKQLRQRAKQARLQTRLKP